MKLETLKVPSAGRSSVSSKSNAAAGKQTAPAPVRQKVAHGGSRRTQRVLLRVRANIHVALQGKPVTFDVITLSVNLQGAIVVMKQTLPPETRLVLEHGTTKERVACKVTRLPKEMPEGFHVPLEFDSPAPDFWKIAFPPSDWTSAEEA
ncbi:MAG TPA: hypothetical protein VMJ93_15115 [Verrucomicrobiae bacterium]|nr:hypothetical protein [Verrucomicrobiae bacterium]